MSYTLGFIESELPTAIEDLMLGLEEVQTAISEQGDIEYSIACMRAALDRLTVQCRVVRRLQLYDEPNRKAHLIDTHEGAAPPGVLLH